MRPLTLFVCSLEWRYDDPMKPKPDSKEYENFTNLLRRVVSVPHAEIKRRMEEDKTTKELTEKSGQPKRRQRPIVSPAAVASSKRAN
jgi:hypothetical protein